MPRDVGVLLVAAGRSRRMGGAVPKVYHDLNGRPVLAASLDVLAQFDALGALVVVIREEDRSRARSIIEASQVESSRVQCVVGGAERHDSVRNGLAALDAMRSVEVVLVHDAARPRATLSLFERVTEAARRHGAVVPGVSVVDTLKREDARGHLQTVPREALYAIQTPQGFRVDWLREAHASPPPPGVTDDAMLLEALGRPVHRVDGEPGNIKLTQPSDFAVLRADSSSSETRS